MIYAALNKEKPSVEGSAGKIARKIIFETEEKPLLRTLHLIPFEICEWSYKFDKTLKLYSLMTTKPEKCTDLKTAKKLFGGNAALATSLFARINAMQQASVIKDIVMMPTFHFHKLSGNMEGYFAIDVKTRRDPWRIIIQPLDENEEPYDPCNIDEIAGVVRIVEVKEVNNHYE